MYGLSKLFFKQWLELQDSACNGCYELTTLSLNFSDIAIITVKIFDYCGFIHSICKFDAIYLLKNVVLEFS